MDGNIGKLLLIFVALGGLSACGMTKPYSGGYKMQSYAASTDLNSIQPAAGHTQDIALNAAPQKSCSFSSFHRKNAIGYELDESTHLGFNVSPKFDVFNPSDMEVKVGFRFTKALGGAANKRPKCTYGSGYYGFLPFAVNDKINVGGLTDTNNIKSFVQDKLNAREERRKAREAKVRL